MRGHSMGRRHEPCSSLLPSIPTPLQWPSPITQPHLSSHTEKPVNNESQKLFEGRQPVTSGPCCHSSMVPLHTLLSISVDLSVLPSTSTTGKQLWLPHLFLAPSTVPSEGQGKAKMGATCRLKDRKWLGHLLPSQLLFFLLAQRTLPQRGLPCP